MKKSLYVPFVLIAINFAAFAAQYATPEITENFALEPDIIERPWILITSMFLHGSLYHILGNMFALGLFGIILANIIGGKKFIVLYFVSGIFAGIVSSFYYDSAIGASGAIFGILGTLAVLRPRMVVWTYGAPMPMVVAAGFWLLLDILGTFYPSNTANLAHIAGLGLGVAAGFALKKSYPAEKPRKRSNIMSEKEFERWENDWM